MIILKEGKHFTPSGLKDYVNKHFREEMLKNGKESANNGDVHQYILHKKLPNYMGGVKLKTFHNKEIGLKYIELDV